MTDAISLDADARPPVTTPPVTTPSVTTPAGKPVRYRLERDYTELVPVHVVWEVTLACNLKCQHCGSRAGRPRSDELTTAEALELIDHLAALGTRELTLIGGEAYLRRDWIELIRRSRQHGIRTGVQTGARNLTDKRLDEAVEAGLQGLGVSIDGLPDLHDRVRGVPGSYDQAIDALRRAKARGLAVSVNTQIGAETAAHLPELMDRIIEAGATHWQIQLTVAMGNAVDNPELLLQPYQLLDVMPLLARLYDEGQARGLLMVVGNNIGYFGPYEHIWRGFGDETDHWNGCSAGQTGIGIEADGTIKGCPSLATSLYTAGNVRDMTVADIWRHSEKMSFGRLRDVEELWGYCRTCYYADVCRAGCTWTSESLLGKRGNNPYCHHRALDLAKHGLRERVVKIKEAPPESFAVGEFALITEAIPGAEATPLPVRDPAAVHVAPRERSAAGGALPPSLKPCAACAHYIWPHETTCPHCQADVAEAEAGRQADTERRRALIAEATRVLGRLGVGA
ncbi:GDL motif peptide-associated radical SAM/SPASM maturase [Caulobacter rhizosphaerae]|jgi:Y-X(10)_GDL-associated radical SAM protein|uniref:Y-X(10)_GDL-associated radical SAM protein n=1 Tax=Caulobacter rhizosphaerae TaxID=2010972 RepID=A0ABU1MTB3_9CAUL|nr:GDL motif peptide-associated radical SAM/SPASM maturase [Caulobacter rhizosphaerae]MDR6529414.1 Y-X(10)_GDL-associated radical SAM protein [Caulobacter rhizosphaerae]GGL23249.1 GDL motif peptide-associated radical SAM/SPASM maturase [Caulobacter rhizosphaerae]